MDLSVSTLHAPSPCISFLCLLWISYPKSLCISFVSPMCLPVFPLDLQFRTSLYLPSHHFPISSCVSSDFPVFSINLYVSPLDSLSRISLYLLIPALPVSPIPHLPMSTWVFLYLPWISPYLPWIPHSKPPCIFHASFCISPGLVIPDFPQSPLNFPSWISVYESPCIFLCLLWISYRESRYIAREASHISFVPSTSPCISSNCPKNSLYLPLNYLPLNSNHEFSCICQGLYCSLDFSGSSCRFLESPIRNLPDPLVSPTNLPGSPRALAESSHLSRITPHLP
jgi:hypothetical protein